MALELSNNILTHSNLLNNLNLKYKKNTILLIVAKYLATYIERKLLQINVVQALSGDTKCNLVLECNYFYLQSMMLKKYPEINFTFYTFRSHGPLHVVKNYFRECIKNLMDSAFLELPNLEIIRQYSQSVFMYDEGPVGLEDPNKGQPYWIRESKTKNNKYPVYIISRNKKLMSQDNLRWLSENKIAVIRWNFFKINIKNNLQPTRISADIERDCKLLVKFSIKELKSENFSIYMHLFRILCESKRMSQIASYLKCKKFISIESSPDAINIFSNLLNIKTIAVQYSNLGFMSPLMLSTSDYQMIFSEQYESLYTTEDIRPKEFIVNGYLYDYAKLLVSDRSVYLRNNILASGANFIICYFDENVRIDKWGFNNKKDHLQDIHSLAKKILLNQDIAVLIKSQFVRNTPSNLYPDDKIIQGALKSGRFIELVSGDHRNNVLPIEAGLSADICINHLIGATAGLEAALGGSRVILLDSQNIKNKWKPIYMNSNIIYGSIEDALSAIDIFREGIDEANLGDWSSIINLFDPYMDNMSTHRLSKLIEAA